MSITPKTTLWDYKIAGKDREIAALQEEIRQLRMTLEKYKNCRHACIDCFCTMEARAALCPK